jgi:hypothetical protein
MTITTTRARGAASDHGDEIDAGGRHGGDHADPPATAVGEAGQEHSTDRVPMFIGSYTASADVLRRAERRVSLRSTANPVRSWLLAGLEVPMVGSSCSKCERTGLVRRRDFLARNVELSDPRSLSLRASIPIGA